jgi:hypothetical protein
VSENGTKNPFLRLECECSHRMHQHDSFRGPCTGGKVGPIGIVACDCQKFSALPGQRGLTHIAQPGASTALCGARHIPDKLMRWHMDNVLCPDCKTEALKRKPAWVVGIAKANPRA